MKWIMYAMFIMNGEVNYKLAKTPAFSNEIVCASYFKTNLHRGLLEGLRDYMVRNHGPMYGGKYMMTEMGCVRYDGKDPLLDTKLVLAIPKEIYNMKGTDI